MKRTTWMAVLLLAAACGGGGEPQGQVPSDQPGAGPTADSAQKDVSGPNGPRTGG